MGTLWTGSLLSNQRHHIFKELTVILMTFDIGEAGMRREIFQSPDRSAAWNDIGGIQ